jgi:hypothetical protein
MPGHFLVGRLFLHRSEWIVNPRTAMHNRAIVAKSDHPLVTAATPPLMAEPADAAGAAE